MTTETTTPATETAALVEKSKKVAKKVAKKPSKASKKPAKKAPARKATKAKDSKKTAKKSPKKAPKPKKKAPPKNQTKFNPEDHKAPAIAILPMQQQIILYSLNRVSREILYKQLAVETGLTSNVVSRYVNKKGDENSLVAQKLVTLKQYERKDNEWSAPYWIEITDKGRKLVG